MLVPDSRHAAKTFPSPNHGERQRSERPSIIVLHYTGMPQASDALLWLCNPISQVSCHYFVFEDGRILQLVPESRRAWHAGQGSWRGVEDVNSASIGIEIANPGHQHGYLPFPAPQVEAVTALCRDLVERYGIAPVNVIAHSDMAPMRKDDPGELFPWQHLAQAGVGLHVPPEPIGGGRFFSTGDRGQPVEALQAMLAMLGYPVPVSSIYDGMTEATVRAFQRHHRPALVDGVADASTVTTLRNLLRKVTADAAQTQTA